LSFFLSSFFLPNWVVGMAVICRRKQRLLELGFLDIEYRLSYAGQAYLVRCRKLNPRNRIRGFFRGTIIPLAD
jgi:hypothetical protein